MIEHGTLIDDETAAFVAQRGAYIVPTMAIIAALLDYGRKMGLSAVSQEKMEAAGRTAVEGLEIMRKAGIKIGFGTDLLGATYTMRDAEFVTRRKVFTAVEILRQATSMGAEILMRPGELGCIAPGAFADMIVVDGDPTVDIDLLARHGQALSVIMRGGELIRCRL